MGEFASRSQSSLRSVSHDRLHVHTPTYKCSHALTSLTYSPTVDLTHLSILHLTWCVPSASSLRYSFSLFAAPFLSRGVSQAVATAAQVCSTRVAAGACAVARKGYIALWIGSQCGASGQQRPLSLSRLTAVSVRVGKRVSGPSPRLLTREGQLDQHTFVEGESVYYLLHPVGLIGLWWLFRLPFAPPPSVGV